MNIHGSTQLLALIGDPVTHAKTPHLANQLLKEKHLLGKYLLLPLHVSRSDLSSVVQSLRHIQNFAGAVITMPHKTAIVPLLDTLSPEAEMVGAVNVIRREASGALTGTIMDGEGFVQGLLQAGHAVQQTRCLLKGAGGVASAIAFALAKHGCQEIVISNRNMQKAQQLANHLAQQFPVTLISTSTAPSGMFDISINATSLGMQADDILPFSEAVIEQSHLVAECVISVDETPLLKLAKYKGRRIHAGLPMLHAQLNMMLGFMMNEAVV